MTFSRFATKTVVVQVILHFLANIFRLLRPCFLVHSTSVSSVGLHYEEEQDKFKKHYDLIFTCLLMRAVHLEACPDLKTHTFLNAYSRFTSLRCQPVNLYSDNGKTFVVANEELKNGLKDINNDKFHKELAQHRAPSGTSTHLITITLAVLGSN